MRTVLVFLTLITVTPVLGLWVILAALLGVRDREGSVYDKAPRWWATCLVRAAGLTVRLHNEERMRSGAPRIFVSNHVSWFDVLTLASVLPRYKFVGKAELFRIPIFGRAARAAGMIAIERENRKSAFESYRIAADRIRAGASVVVFPEGTRGRSYALRQFKKGPFVLAVAAGVPIVPTIVHGTMEVIPRDSFRIRSGVVDIHFLEPIPSSGMTYEDRNRLSRAAWERMADAMHALYGVASADAVTPVREGAAAD
ncbi:MAG TPA: lysophospholipid acyltransferase family protein [Gemmatimonadaceae bacterium]|jgi:1-acyl-sn-glycerol-3-phosphate acyltransferase|nr:lysophospholipid acyltransferase family protein [Gemmatimonadaceae bacterium]